MLCLLTNNYIVTAPAQNVSQFFKEMPTFEKYITAMVNWHCSFVLVCVIVAYLPRELGSLGWFPTAGSEVYICYEEIKRNKKARFNFSKTGGNSTLIYTLTTFRPLLSYRLIASPLFKQFSCQVHCVSATPSNY